MTPAEPRIRQKRARSLPDQREPRVRPPTEAAVPPERVWATLSPPLQAQLHQTLLRITQEVLHEAQHR
jgi:hypothetical protein